VRHRFGTFTLDDDTRQLLRRGKDVHLSPKTFDLLSFLVRNRSRAVSKVELQEKVWPDTFVEETNLAGLIVQLRRALHDSAGNPKFIHTVYGFGYRFVGDVQADTPAARAQPRNRFSLTLLDRRLALVEGPNVVGRSEDAPIQIVAPGVSRRHARIVVRGDQAILEDLGSKNGTHLNGHRVSTPCVLADGDRIQFGAVEAAFSADADLSATETLTTLPE
jgi:DNA-binding winged helix-turn-helix (wHTH) protein